jgi:SAM-dependent methyltransferase
MTTRSSYDEIAGMYHSLWADWYLPAALPALEKLFFERVPIGSRVLDLCCGSGHVTKELIRRGYRVTGIDNSRELIEAARRELPGADFQVQDARQFELAERFHAVLSTFDSLNHILELDELRRVFDRVYRALRPDGVFVFDMNLAEAYAADLRQWSVDIKDDSVGMVRGIYDDETKKASTELIWFVKKSAGNTWEQHRSVVEQRCYRLEEILIALNQAGFRKIETNPATAVGVTSDLGFGRVFFSTSPQD